MSLYQKDYSNPYETLGQDTVNAILQSITDPRTAGVASALGHMAGVVSNPYVMRDNFGDDHPLREEVKFQQWIRGLPWFNEFKQEYGEEPNLHDPNFDYRYAWKSGVEPQRYQYDTEPNKRTGYVPPEGGRYHWSSKAPDGTWLKNEKTHPTAWMETFMEQTGIDPNELAIKDPRSAMLFLQSYR